MITLPELLLIVAFGGLLAVALRVGLRTNAGGRAAAPGQRYREPDTNPYRALRILPAQSFRTPAPERPAARLPRLVGRAARPAANGCEDALPPSALATDWVRRLLGVRYTLVAEVPLVDLVRFEHPRYGTPAEHRELRVRTASWVIGDRASGRVRLVIAPPCGLRSAIEEALEAEGVPVWSFERWGSEVQARDAVVLRNALVRAGMPIDPPEVRG